MSSNLKTFFSSILSRLWLTARLHPHKEPPDGWTLPLSFVHRVPFVIFSFLLVSSYSRLRPAPFTLLSVTLSLLVSPWSLLSVWLPVSLQLCRINASVWRSEFILKVTRPQVVKLKIRYSKSLCWTDPVLTLFIPHKSTSSTEYVADNVLSLQWTTVCLLQFTHGKEKSVHIWSAFCWESHLVPRWQGVTKLCWKVGKGEKTLIKSRTTLTVNYGISMSDTLKVQQSVRDG